jgi:hypothetical protein
LSALPERRGRIQERKIEWGLLDLDVEVEEVEDDGLIRTCVAGGSTLGLRV